MPAGERKALGVPFRSLVAGACERLRVRAGQRLVGEDADLRTVVGRFGEQLTGWLVDIAARALDGEPGRRSPVGGRGLIAELPGSAEPGRLDELFARYPMLTRLLSETARFGVDAQVELLTRLAVDRTAIVTALLGGVDPGPVVAIHARQGDAHRGGRSVSIIEFADGRRVVYRPRDVGTHVLLGELVAWLNGMAPGIEARTLAVVAKEGYGWLEFVGGSPPVGRDGAIRFYRRLGALLALLHAVRAVDMHHENVIVDGDQPVLVDVEALFHPELVDPRTADPARRALAASVYRTGLLPQFLISPTAITDISALGGVRLGLPRTDPAGHRAALLDGFRRGYDAIMRNRAEFSALVTRCADIETRVVVRSTRWYVKLLAEAARHERLRDADRVLAAALTSGAFGARLARYEAVELSMGDVPLFTGRPDSIDVWTSGGRRLPRAFHRGGLSGSLDLVAEMNEADRRDQEWIISAAMASRRPVSHHSETPMPGTVVGAVADPQRLLAAACAIADQLVSRSIVDDERVTWLGLEPVDERQWLVMPMGAGLGNGYLGVALFLAQLAELSGVTRYEQVARSTISAVPRLFETLSAQPAMVAAIGHGGLHGFGGIAFGLARIARLLADDEIRDLAGMAVDFAAAVTEPTPPGWATGTAGCLAAMTAVHAELALPAAAELARDCADRLVDTVDSGEPLTPGFADGAAGIAWALTNHASRLPDGADARHTHAAHTAADVAAAALADSERARRFGWCAGMAGLVLASPPDADSPSVRAVSQRPLLRDLSLCHGELGIAEVLAATHHGEPARRRHAGLVLDAIDRYDPWCGTPDGVPTPGLLTGLAGIGYGLLRLGFTDRVPSVLLLESQVIHAGGINEYQYAKARPKS